MSFIQNRNLRVLIILMFACALIAVVIAYLYYKAKNDSVDPRTLSARHKYEKYNTYAQNNEIDSVIHLMNDLKLDYETINHYKDSYEIGVIYNNLSAAYLTLALDKNNPGIDEHARDSLVHLSETAARNSIRIYLDWLNTYQNKSKEDIQAIASINFFDGLENYSESLQEKFFKARVGDILTAQTDTPRRLSVSYTNIGIIHRTKGNYDSAAIYYKKGLDLWDRNLTAENNINILLGRPVKKRNILQKLFPPLKD